MIRLLIILLISSTAYGQCDTTETVRMPLYFHVTDTSHYWNYYEANGTVLWRNVKEYDVSLIPAGGFIGNGDYIKQPYIVKGFGLFRVKRDCCIEIIKRVDVNNKDIEIKGRLINPAILTR